jgi:hypothetical protein
MFDNGTDNEALFGLKLIGLAVLVYLVFEFVIAPAAALLKSPAPTVRGSYSFNLPSC